MSPTNVRTQSPRVVPLATTPAEQYHARLALAAEISRAPGGFTVRVSEHEPFLLVHSSKTRGWLRLTPEAARLADAAPPRDAEPRARA